MAFWARAKSILGGDRTVYTLTSGATLAVPDSSNYIELTGTATVTALNAAAHTRNRMVVFYSTSGTTTFTNTDGTTTAGQLDLNGANVNLAKGDILVLWLRTDGVWVPVSRN